VALQNGRFILPSVGRESPSKGEQSPITEKVDAERLFKDAIARRLQPGYRPSVQGGDSRTTIELLHFLTQEACRSKSELLGRPVNLRLFLCSAIDEDTHTSSDGLLHPECRNELHSGAVTDQEDIVVLVL